MRFAFTSEQLELRDAVESFLASAWSTAQLRAAWEATPGSLDRSVWRGLAEMGVFDVLVPEADGGLGLDWCSLVLILETTGRFAVPHPVVETAAVTAPLPGRPAASELTSLSLGGDFAVCGADADWLLVDHEEALWLLPADAVAGSPVASVDRGRRLMAIEALDLSRAHRLADGPVELEAALDRAALGAAAQLLGLSQAMLDMTVAYVSERHQFGVPVGSFQAVKHRLADALKELEFAGPAVYRAAWSMSVADPDSHLHVSMAKAMASEAAEVVGRAALQCHGAIGYAFEYDLHLYLKRAWALSRAWGSAGWHRQRIGRALGV